MENKSLFIDEVNKIKSDDLRECALELVEEIPHTSGLFPHRHLVSIILNVIWERVVL